MHHPFWTAASSRRFHLSSRRTSGTVLPSAVRRFAVAVAVALLTAPFTAKKHTRPQTAPPVLDCGELSPLSLVVPTYIGNGSAVAVAVLPFCRCRSVTHSTVHHKKAQTPRATTNRFGLRRALAAVQNGYTTLWNFIFLLRSQMPGRRQKRA
jgi:hypothetical protein